MAWTSESVPSTGSNWTAEAVPSFIGWTSESTPVTNWKHTGHFGWAITCATETGSVTNNSSFTVTITFDEIVVDFDVTDFNLINCTISSLAGSGKVYTATCTKSYFGQLTVAILNGRVTDDKGNKNSIGTPFSIDVQPSIFKSSWTLSGAERTIKLPLINGGNYNFDIDWGDDTVSTVTAWNQVIDEGGAAMTHTYANAGTYNIEIGGASNYTIVGWQFNNNAALDKDKIRDISDWGPLNISTPYTFYGCTNLSVSAANAPIISGDDLQRAFDSCSALSGLGSGISLWDVSSIDDTYAMFRNCTNFNGDISTWNVSSVTQSSAMFSGCTNFNQDLSSWNFAALILASDMFFNCTNFNNGGDEGTSSNPLDWTLSTNLRGLASVFKNCTKFNQDISDWNTSTATHMNAMFYSATSFNQDISSWDVSDVEDMSYMFYNCDVFNQNIGSWNTTEVTNMTAMFRNCTNFNQDISDWNTVKVTTMNNMFNSCSAFNQPINTSETVKWNTGAVTDMISMFNGSGFNSDISDWDTSSVLTMYYMFGWNSAFNQDIGSWDVSSVTNMSYMFYEATAFNGNIGSWGTKTGAVATMASMFYNCDAFNQDISNWDTSEVTDMSNMFKLAHTFNQDINTSETVKWNTGAVTTMVDMFLGCTAFNNGGSSGTSSNPLDNWDTSSVTAMNGMFYGCTIFNQDISDWNTAAVAATGYMFHGCSAFNQDINTDGDKWNTSAVTSMGSMFRDATAFNQNISGWDVNQVADFAHFLNGNTALSTGNYNLLLHHWEADNPLDNKAFHGGDATTDTTSGSVDGTAARTRLEDNHNWIITDGN